jgi:Tol biopolymer transport system component
MYVWSPYLDQPLREILSAAEFGLDMQFFGWRPRSRQIVCWSGVGEWHGIFLLDVETGERTTVVQPEEWADLLYPSLVHGLAFSPDGEQMIVSFKPPLGEDWELWTARSDGTEARQLFTSPGFVAGMSWSPDGKWVSFINRGVEVMSPDGEGRRTVGTRFIGGQSPAWSPDSRYLAFTANNPTPSEPSHDAQDPGTDFSPYTVRIADVLTGEERDLVPDTVGGEILPTWSPDGSQVAFLSDRGGATEVWVADADGANLRQVTFDGQPKRGTPAWISLHLP